MSKKLSFGQSLFIVLFLLVSIAACVIFWEMDPQIPIVLTTAVAAVMAAASGIRWEDLEDSMVNVVNTITPSMLFLLAMGMMLGSWLHSGIVPTMIFYGSKLISPTIFLPTTFLLCSASSLITGDSWATAATVGIALLGVGITYGVPAPIIAGAIVSGSYFGDKLSPISDTTVLASGVSNVEVFDHVKCMLYTTIPSTLISMIAYFFIGLKFAEVEIEQIIELQRLLKETFVITPILLLIPLLVLVLIFSFKIKAIPALIAGSIGAGIFAILFQGSSLPEVLDAMHYGVEMDTGYELIDELIVGGGLDYVMWTISLVLCAMALAGVLDGTGATEALVNKILTFVKSTGDLIAATVVSSIFLNIATADQYLAIIFPARMFKGEYEKKNIDPRILSRTLEDAGTLTSPLIPWNTCGAFVGAALGVNPFAYLPYAILCWFNPILAIIYGYTDKFILYTDGKSKDVAEGTLDA